MVSDYKTTWQIVEHSWSSTSIYDDNDEVICTLSIEDRATEENQSELEKEMDAKARIIASAPLMLKVRKELASALNLTIDTTKTCYGINNDHRDMIYAAVCQATVTDNEPQYNIGV